MVEIGKFDINVNAIPNGLEKYMVFTINKYLLSIHSMQFMNSSLEKIWLKTCQAIIWGTYLENSVVIC